MVEEEEVCKKKVKYLRKVQNFGCQSVASRSISEHSNSKDLKNDVPVFIIFECEYTTTLVIMKR